MGCPINPWTQNNDAYKQDQQHIIIDATLKQDKNYLAKDLGSDLQTFDIARVDFFKLDVEQDCCVSDLYKQDLKHKQDIFLPKPDLYKSDLLLKADLVKDSMPLIGIIWYIRTNGGTRAQCDGKTDADYSSGINRHCAFKHPFYLFTDNVSSTIAWVVKGGDTIIIRGGPYKLGYQGPTNSYAWSFCAGDPYGCYNPTIPAGSINAHTRILGENYANCNSKTKLLGAYAVRNTLNLASTQYVDFECFEITDSAQCGRIGNSNGCSSNFPLDDYADDGVEFNNKSANISLKNIDIHGLASGGIGGSVGGNILLENVRTAFNASAGWDLDDGTLSTGGTVTLKNVIVEWNGCIEQYPIANTIPAFKCFDDNVAGYGDGIGTPDSTYPNWTISQSTFRYNTQDGLDLLHQSGNVSVSILRSAFYGNMGQQYKAGAISNTIVQNNIFVHNCMRMSAAFTGAPSGYNSSLSDFCRAAGDGLAINLSSTGTFRFENNTYVGYGATTMDIGCDSGSCASSGILRNNIFLGYSNQNYNSGQIPGMFYYEGSSSVWGTRSNNIFWNVRNLSCPTGYAGEACVDPSLQNAPAFSGEASLDAFNLHLQSISPAVDKGFNTGLSNDYDGVSRPQGLGYDIGAFEYK